jgi:hypothetical protein
VGDLRYGFLLNDAFVTGSTTTFSGAEAFIPDGQFRDFNSFTYTATAADAGKTLKIFFGQSGTSTSVGLDNVRLHAQILPLSVLSINRADANPNQTSSVRFTVTFSQSVTGVDSSDFAIVRTGSISGGTVSGVTGVSGSGMTYTVTVSGFSGVGTIGLNLVDNDSILDLSGNKLGGTGGGQRQLQR